MRIPKKQIRLSEFHPSLLVDLDPQSVFMTPVVINQEGILVDGYRRYRLQYEEELEAIQLPTRDLFEAALDLNYRTRIWDDIDCFFWMRWARALQVSEPKLPVTRFSQELFHADVDLLRFVANRKLLLRQAQLILQAPARYRPFFQDFLTKEIRLNANESASFIEMACDLARMQGKNRLEDVLEEPSLNAVVGNPNLTPKQKGEALLKEMRVLRYPYYQKKSEEFSSYWRQLKLEKDIQAKKSFFLERGVLEISLSAWSLQELKEKVNRLYRSMDSSIWEKIWK